MQSVSININSLPPQMVNEDGIRPLSRTLAVSTKGSNSKKTDGLHCLRKLPSKATKNDARSSRRPCLGGEGRATSTRHLFRQVENNKSGRRSRGRSLTPPPPQRKGRMMPAGSFRRKSAYKKEDGELSSSTNSTTSTASTCSSRSTSSAKKRSRAPFPKVSIPAVAPGPSALKKSLTMTTTTTTTETAVDSSESVSSDTTHSRQRMTFSVSFDITEIREYPMILDEGNCDGPAMLTIDWHHQATEVTTVQEYDLERSYEREKREHLNNGQTTTMKPLQPNERAAILIRSGGCNDVAFLAKSLSSTNSSKFKNENLEECARSSITKTAHPKKKKTTMISKMKKKAKQVVKGGNGSK